MWDDTTANRTAVQDLVAKGLPRRVTGELGVEVYDLTEMGTVVAKMLLTAARYAEA